MGVQINGDTGNVSATKGTYSNNLTVGGVLTFEDVTNVDSIGIVTARTDINLGDSIIHIDDTNTKIRFPAADTITAETGGSERLRIDSSGKLGIGMNSDQKTALKGKLDIDASGIDAAGDTDDPNDYAIVIRNPSTTDQGNGIAFTNDSGANVGGAIIHIDKGSNNIGDLAFYTSATSNTPIERLRIKSDGNVDIGGGTHSRNLTVHSATNSVILIEGNSDATSNLMFGDQNDEDVGLIQYSHASNFLAFTVNTEERLRIASNGEITQTAASGDTIITLKRSDTNTTGLTGGINFAASDGHSVASIQARGDGDNEGAHLQFYTTTAAAGDMFNAANVERLRITSTGHREIRNYHYGPWAFVNNTTKTTITVGDPGDNKFTTIKLILTLIDVSYRQGMWQGEYTIFASNATGGPGVNYYLKEHWQQVGSANWSGATVGVSITSGGSLQIIADNDHNDAAGNAYIHILDVIGDIDGSSVSSISP